MDDLYADYYNEVSVDASQYYYVETPSFTSSSIGNANKALEAKLLYLTTTTTYL